MANKTKNYGLTKPTTEEFYDVNVQNENMDKIDEVLKGLDNTFATEKTTLTDADTIPLNDNGDSNKLKKITWAKIKEILTNVFAAKSHNHSASDINNGTLPVARGGTGATDASTARTNLGITPANIGAASNVNPKFTGGVTLDEIVGLVLNADGIVELTIKHKTEQGNSRKLYVAPSDAVEDLEMAILLGDESRGLTRLYKLYGDHNPKAGALHQDPNTSLLRNSKLVNTETNPTVNGEICWTYE